MSSNTTKKATSAAKKTKAPKAPTVTSMADTPSAYPVFYRTYSRRQADGSRESWAEVCERATKGLLALGRLSSSESRLIHKMMVQRKSMPSGRWLWVGGTDWLSKPQNVPGAYNCTSTTITNIKSIAELMNLAMMGCGTGAVLEEANVAALPPVLRAVKVKVIGSPGDVEKELRADTTTVKTGDWGNEPSIRIEVGDSREGWIDAYYALMSAATTGECEGIKELIVRVDVSHVRAMGEPLSGFGGIANPIKLADMFSRVSAVLNRAVGRPLRPLEVCLLIDEAAACVVAGNVRRSAGMRQFSKGDVESGTAKDNLWAQDKDGNWAIDPDKDALRMANHTRVFMKKPTVHEVRDSVAKQFHSGEGAIQWAPEAIARANTDLLECTILSSGLRKELFLKFFDVGPEEARAYLAQLYRYEKGQEISAEELDHRMGRYGLNPCLVGETLIPVKGQGLMRIRDLAEAGVAAKIRDADGNWVYAIPRKTAENQSLMVVTLSDGSQYTVTPYHDFVTADGCKVKAVDLQAKQELMMSLPLQAHGTVHAPNDAYLDAWLIADGTWSGRNKDQSKLYLYEPKFDHEKQLAGVGASFKNASSAVQERKVAYFKDREPLPKDCVPSYVLQGDLETKLAFLDGYLQSDGHEGFTKNGWVVQITSIYRSILQDIQAMLRTIDVYSTIAISHEAQSKYMPDNKGLGNNKKYWCQTAYRLTISNPVKLFEYLRPERVARGSYKKDRHIFVESVVATNRIEDVYCFNVPTTHSFDLPTVHSGNCGEIIGKDFFCNLAEVHLNQLNPENIEEQEKAFTAAALSVAALLHHELPEEVYAKSRDLDPIVGVSFTGFFDYCVKAFGVKWLEWFAEGRPDNAAGEKFKRAEAETLSWWRGIVETTIGKYCAAHGLKCPNRCTTVQPAGTKSLLTGASSGWHPPKSQRFIRRVTFGKNDPVALACIDYGYNVIPSQSDKDEDGKLLDDPFDPRCTEWLVELPTEVSWANLPGADKVEIEKFSALAQFDFYMQVQKYYTMHNTSATIELREEEIGALSQRIHTAIDEGEGYISAALLARFDDLETFPRLPFEPISKKEYTAQMKAVMKRRGEKSFAELMTEHDQGVKAEEGPAGCDSDKCLMPLAKPS